jgi:hypothetical protein
LPEALRFRQQIEGDRIQALTIASRGAASKRRGSRFAACAAFLAASRRKALDDEFAVL